MLARILLLAIAIGLDAACGAPPPLSPGAAEGPPDGPGAQAAARPLFDAARVIDLSYPFDERTIYWPTARPFELKSDSRGRTAGGYWYASSTLCASEHGGTHLDAPFHFAETGRTTDAIPLSALIAPAAVVDVRPACAADPDHAVGVDEIRTFEARHGAIPAGAVVVLHTGWGERWPDRKAYLGDDTPGNASRLRFPGLSAGAARYLAERKVAGVGIDTASIDPGSSRDFIAHRILAAGDVYNLENLDSVEQLPATGATLVALPMKITGGTGGPARVIAILP